MKIKKKSGRKEEFLREKLFMSIVKCGGSPELAHRVAHKVMSDLTKDIVVNSRDVRDGVVKALKQYDARVYKLWLSHEKQMGKAR